ncbi:sensor histidine kinase [Alsobacter soli]|uniref:histidine kinase n=1 Tax=Alsobacter soli TaxID=2109933 RepID=A0A2T1HVE5_9HYPH|nr:HAMP domain-containing sensor histidine kinase [Alsobacter soli]PSC05643.1 sensor histidine kinase [Alsobacter soli]
MTERSIPLAIKLPVVVTVFMAVVAAFVSERVLVRLEETQARHLGDLATVYLDGLSSALASPVVREDVWETFDILDRARQTNAGLKPVLTVVANTAGRVIASSDPKAVPSWSELPSRFLHQGAATPAIEPRDQESEAVARVDLSTGGQVVGSIHAVFDTAPLLAERRSVLITLIGTNLALTSVLAGVAFLVVRRMMRPVGVLAGHLQAGADRGVEPIPASVIERALKEFKRLYASYNDMAVAVREREEWSQRMAEDERLASLGRLASGMAHEINNPLGGLFNALDTLRQHGERSDVRAKTLDLIERGLRGIRDVVRAALVTYRADEAPRLLHREDVDDLRLLVAPEIRRKDIALAWTNGAYAPLPLGASPVRQVLLNLLLNACEATRFGGEIRFSADVDEGQFVAVVDDDGPGPPDRLRSILESQANFVPRERGLGLLIVQRLLTDLGGSATVHPSPSGGTLIRVVVPLPSEVLADVA